MGKGQDELVAPSLVQEFRSVTQPREVVAEVETIHSRGFEAAETLGAFAIHANHRGTACSVNSSN